MQVATLERPGYTLVSPSGVLSRRTTGDLRAAVLKAAAEQPDAVVCDLGAVVVDPAALTLLLLLADQLEQWPACAFGVVAAEPSLRSALVALGLSRRAAVGSSVDEVVGALQAPRPDSRATLRLAPGRRAPREARAFLTAAAGRWPVAQADLDDATLVLDELVTNAVLHAGTEIEVLLSVLSGRLRLAVADQARPLPLGRSARRDDENGRGLALVEALSLRWGVIPRRPHGKVVWAVMGSAREPLAGRAAGTVPEACRQG